MMEMDLNPVDIYTDGACKGNPGPGGWGVLLALCTGAFPLLSYLKAKLEPEKHGGAP